MSRSETRKVLTVKEVAETLSISLPKAYELTRTHDFPAIHIGKRIIIPVAALDKWLMRSSNEER